MLGRLLLLLGSLLFGLIVLELGARLLRGPEWLSQWPNLVPLNRAESATDVARYAVYDEGLGFAPLPEARLLNMARESDGTIRRTNASHDAQGLRLAPAGAPLSLPGPPILAAGDSFTYGAEVDDADTWPVALQSLLGQTVVNAGANGYGIDQIVLRVERIARTVHPGVIVVALIHDDLRRAEMSRVWGADKPYFDVAGNTLALRNVPVPPPAAQHATLTLWQRLLGRSVLVQMTMQALGLMDAWSHDDLRVHPAGEGDRIACLLMKRLAAYGRKIEARTMVVGLYDADAWRWRWLGALARQHRALDATLSCAAKAGIETIDTYDDFDRAISAEGVDALYHRWHPNAAGNRLIADLIAARLR
ncbi:MAG: SGNH/GDSL hydrolase family protein [Reyranella sp.]|uniref:SGNH/GDSL hydrolase family protein n=1 Tax=Reyranella sp. TaxID=1929291 RepID=UPI003D10B688